MAKWKLSRQGFGNEEFTFEEGEEVSIGRGYDNKITLSSIVISRNHCKLKVQKDNILITDLKSSNGTYVGSKKVPIQSTLYAKHNDLIGFGWTTVIDTLPIITDNDKHVFKLMKEKVNESTGSKIQYLEDSDDNLELQVATLDGAVELPNKIKSEPKSLKRKANDEISSGTVKVKKGNNITDNTLNNGIPKVSRNGDVIDSGNVVYLLSDSENETTVKEPIKGQNGIKEIKMEPILEEPPKQSIKEEILKTENEMPEYEVFDVKQEYLGFDDNEAIEIDDSDSDGESEQWYIRLSQSSPGKPFMRRSGSHIVPQQENTSYSQIEGPIELDNEEEFYHDIISIPPQPQPTESDNKISSDQIKATPVKSKEKEAPNKTENQEPEEEIMNDIISFSTPIAPMKHAQISEDKGTDRVDGFAMSPPKTLVQNQNETEKRAQMIEPLVQLPRRTSHFATTSEAHAKSSSSKSSTKSSSSSSKRSRSSKHTSSKTQISASQKEERKKKLKEIATKDKSSDVNSSKSDNQSSKSKVNIKVTPSNRGAFLAEEQIPQAVVKPMTRKESSTKSGDKRTETSQRASHARDARSEGIEDTKKRKGKDSKESEKHKPKSTKRLSDKRAPLKSLEPLSGSEDTKKPVSKVDPMPPKKARKSVRFSDAPPQIIEFEIEAGNKMNKTSSIKTRLVDNRPVAMPVFSLEKITLVKILRWNPHWLDEQVNNHEPPPILGHNSPPLGMFQAFENHRQYVGQVGDLLLMEIWECITQGYVRVRQQNTGLPMKIVTLPPPPPEERSLDLFNITVEIAVQRSEMRNVPRMGEIMIVYFGPENAKNSRFLYVYNVQQPNNRRPCFTVHMHAIFTEKMRSLHPGQVVTGQSLAYIHKELTLFEAMEHMAGTPLSDIILRPEPYHFPEIPHNPDCNMNSQWTKGLNDSQKAAVSASVSAALGDRPSIQMVQGPPGTGKSCVICAMVMAYFYDSAERKLQNRGKILICATSNAAVDELVLRLLNIRQNLPKTERFRMVRVGRAEAMHPRAREVSSQTLAQRDTRLKLEQPAPALREEIDRLTAKINMWMSLTQEATEPSRVAYCENRVRHFTNKRALLGGGAGGNGSEEPRPEDVAKAERRIIDLADIVLTTLASAINQKMRGLRRRIALCIVDEAGQAIEPETLIPLTLDVTRLTLIGDPQQLPGYICSQRAKRHGLGESLFSRLAGCAESWSRSTRSPVVLLDTQYRMQAAIAEYPVRAFYGGLVRCAAGPRPPLPVPPYTMLAVASGDKGQGFGGGNEMEAWGVTRLVAALRVAARRLRLSLAVITPYNAHKDLIKRNLKAIQQDQSDPGVEVNTVDSFQGQERDIVVVSLARSHGVGFLTDAGRLNVMLTRAKHALIVALNPNAVVRNDQWRTLVEDAQRRRLLRQLPNKMCQPLAPGQPVDDILQYVN